MASPAGRPASPAVIYSHWEGARKGFPAPLVGFAVEVPSSQTAGTCSSPGEQARLAGDSAPGSCHRSPLVTRGGECVSEQP